MAIFKSYYNRKPLGYIHKWCITVSCLYLLCVGHHHASAKGDRTRHHHHHQQTSSSSSDEYVLHGQQQHQLPEDHVRNTPLVTCPNCLYKHDRELKSETDTLRLEAIKRQILSKLGLRHKPNVTYAFPREVIMETLFRAEDSAGFLGAGDREDEDISTTSARTASMETVDVDDFYGRTSEIISFAEQGYRVNGNRLLEFRVSAESGQAGREFRVRAATLWLKADVRPSRSVKCKSTDIYVFKFISNLGRSVKINSKEFNELTDDPLTTSLNEESPGWQKIDLTSTVREWLEADPKERLRLFVDCNCCKNWDVHLFNGDVADHHTQHQQQQQQQKRTDPNRPFLVIHTDPTTAKRVRRRALDCSADSGNQCCKQRFYVSFKELGWDDWIIAPQGYYANYCRGDCGHHRTPDSFVTYHTHVIEEIRKTHHLSGMQPCCAPLKFSSMSLIYFGMDSNIIKRDLPKMVVDECGCP